MKTETLFDTVKRLGIPHDHHESDLYLPDTPEVREVLKAHPVEDINKTGFVSDTDGKLWLDIPFAYLPWWTDRNAARKDQP